MPEERHFRAFARRTVSLPGALGAPDTSSGPRAVHVVNIGLGGACVEIPELDAGGSIATGTRVTLELAPPGLWDPLHVAARVAWVAPLRPNGVRAGLAFQHGGHSVPSGLIDLLGSFR